MSGSMLNLKNVFSFVAGEDIKGKTFVAIHEDGKVYTATSNDTPIGVSDLNVKKNTAVGVATAGIAQVVASAEIKAGQFVTANTDGNAVAVDSGMYAGGALTNASAGAWVSVLLNSGYKTV
jgi:hypothetical protein